MSAKQYFDEIHFPLFYDDARYLQSPGNGPIHQLTADKKTNNPAERKKAKEIIEGKIEKYLKSDDLFPDMSFAIGYPSANDIRPTSSQITNLKLPIDQDDLYASWIGASFGIGIKGSSKEDNFNILFEEDIILEALWEGFSLYRTYVDENEAIKNKIETWNSVWLVHRLGNHYIKDTPKAMFFPIDTNKKGEPSMERSAWTKVIFTLSKIIPNKTITGYIYSFGQMNKTVGFVQFVLPEVNSLNELYKALFKDFPEIRQKTLESIYESEFSFQHACQLGAIGLRAMEPKDLRKYMPGGKDPALPKLKTDEKSIINYYIYQLWIIAMLNNKELLELAEKTALSLFDFMSKEKQTKTNRIRAVEELLGSKNRKDFIDKVNAILSIDKSNFNIAGELVDRIMLDIAPDNIPLFVTLLRFKYLSKQ
jgi:hypothetical protein